MLPKELQILIYEFDPNHRINFKSSLEKIPMKGILSRLKNIDRICDKNIFENGAWDFEKLYIKNISDPLHVLQVLSTCKCCIRHQLKRPYKFRGQIISNKNNSNHEWLRLEEQHARFLDLPRDKNHCSCRCRYTSRFIKKVFSQNSHDFIYSTNWANTA